jgi:predicted RNA-binding protein YlxR (DUF448 family)
MVRRRESRITPDALAGTDTDDDEESRETGALRRCTVTRERLAKEKMIRFVIGPDERVVPDIAARLPGRGIWLSARSDVIQTACTKGAFARAARTSVVVPPDLLSVLQAALVRRVGDHLGLARRAGQAVAGFHKAREWLVGGRAALIVQASDGSADERARFLSGWAERVPVVTPLDGARLGAIFGRDHAVHVAVAAGRLADTLQIEAERLAGLSSGGTNTSAPRFGGATDDVQGDATGRGNAARARRS